MKRTFTRTKDGQTYEIANNEDCELIKAADELLCELQWGVRSNWTDANTLELRTTVFGCEDLTIFTGTVDEMKSLKGLIDNRSSLNSYMLKEMNVDPKGAEYYRSDVIIAYLLHLETGASGDDLGALLTPIVKKSMTVEQMLKHAEDVKQTMNNFPDLGADDGVRKITGQFLGV